MFNLKASMQEGMKSIFDEISPKMAKIFIPWILRHPGYLRNASALIKSYRSSEQLRTKALEEGIVVPPLMIFSITSKCNLRCKGCFAYTVGNLDGRVEKNELKPLMEKEDWSNIISQANELGVCSYLIAGGEPFLFHGLIDLCKEFSSNFFGIFTNGTTINNEDVERLKKLSNVAVIVSIEGGKELTDYRRGTGTFNAAMNAVSLLEKSGVLSGISVTITRANYEYWLEEENLDSFIKQGVRLGFFIEYIPTGSKNDDGQRIAVSPMGNLLMDSPESGETLILTDGEREKFRNKILYYKANKSIFIIHSPGDEEIHGGCVSAGKGFAHVTPYGDLTPCPVSSIATHNLKRDSLKDGLASELFKEIRESEHLLENGDGPCALFAHQKELEELRKKVGGYKTGY